MKYLMMLMPARQVSANPCMSNQHIFYSRQRRKFTLPVGGRSQVSNDEHADAMTSSSS